MSEEKKYYYISSVEKGLAVLELLSEHGSLNVKEVAAHLGYNRAGAHRFLRTLMELGYVQQTEEGKYELTFKLLEMGMKLAGRLEIRKTARVYMQQLAGKYKETVNLGYLDGLDVVHMDKIDSTELLRMDPGLGSRAPAHCTALGKAILAHLHPEDLQTALESCELKTCTSNSIADQEHLLQELRFVREKGCAVDDEELAKGLRCLAVPIFDYNRLPKYALSVSGPVQRMGFERMEEMKADLTRIGTLLSQSSEKGTAESSGNVAGMP